MTKQVITINAQHTILDAAKLMEEKSLGCLVVLDGEKPVGIVTERDFVRRVIARELPNDTKISEVMSKPIRVIDASASIRDAARIMMENKIRRLPVVEESKLVGIVVASDFLRHRAHAKTFMEQVLEALARYPPDYIP